jgi:hypothetical protein
MAPNSFDVAEFRRIIMELKTADFSDSVTLTLDRAFDALRQQSDETFMTFEPNAKITICGDRSSRTPQAFEKIATAPADARAQ